MSVVSTLIGGGVFDVLSKAIDRIWPDKAEADRVKLEMFKLEREGALEELKANLQMATAQTEVNKVEAASSSAFVAGWRPFIGWVCGFGFAYQVLGRPLIIVILKTKGIDFDVPEIESGDLMYILGGILGIGTMRTVEKVKGVRLK